MDRIKIIQERPITHPEICEEIVKAFKKHKLKITLLEARHLWDLHGMDHGFGWMCKDKPKHPPKEIYQALKPYFIVDAS